ncbi:hypothetical protein BTI99_04325 [Lactobacillus delbrueckii subsp. bulgaricus]|nr:hypothetical protein [Lactobacillus delbrueckii subsp. bulgaricus]
MPFGKCLELRKPLEASALLAAFLSFHAIIAFLLPNRIRNGDLPAHPAPADRDFLVIREVSVALVNLLTIIIPLSKNQHIPTKSTCKIHALERLFIKALDKTLNDLFWPE